MRKNKTLNLLGGIFVALGIIFILVGAGVFVFNRENIASCDKVIAYISGLESGEHSNAYVSYEYDGYDYKDMDISFYSSSMKLGDEITIYVEPDNPSKVHVEATGTMIFAIFGGIGLIFFCTGTAFIVTKIIKKRNGERLIDQGISLIAQITDFPVAFNVSYNNRHPFRVECIYTDPSTGMRTIFCSETVLEDPSMVYNIGEDIRVYVQDNTYKKYYVDISKLEQSVKDYR